MTEKTQKGLVHLLYRKIIQMFNKDVKKMYKNVIIIWFRYLHFSTQFPSHELNS